MAESALYQAILARHSVRRYRDTSLDADALARVEEILSAVRPLVPHNRFQVEMRDATSDQDLVAALGGYGRIVNSPHFLVPSIEGSNFLLTDLGYRAEQIAVRLTALGLGSCYIGCLGREKVVREQFGLSAGTRIGAFLVFGRSSETLGGRLINVAMHVAAGAARKLPPEKIFFLDSFDVPASPPADLAPLIEAARNAPSAVNAQPWRFLWHDGALHLFVKRDNPRYGGGDRAQYRLYDGGICMANVALALEALGLPGRWRMVGKEGSEFPPHPPSLQPLARLDRG